MEEKQTLKSRMEKFGAVGMKVEFDNIYKKVNKW